MTASIGKSTVNPAISHKPVYFHNLRVLSKPLDGSVLLTDPDGKIHEFNYKDEPWYAKILLIVISSLGYFLYSKRMNKALDDCYNKFSKMSYDASIAFTHSQIVENLKKINTFYCQKFKEIIFKEEKKDKIVQKSDQEKPQNAVDAMKRAALRVKIIPPKKQTN